MPILPFKQASTANTEFFVNYEDFHFQPQADTESPIVGQDPFASCQFDAMFEAIEMRAARSFDSAVEAGAMPTRRSKLDFIHFCSLNNKRKAA